MQNTTLKSATLRRKLPLSQLEKRRLSLELCKFDLEKLLIPVFGSHRNFSSTLQIWGFPLKSVVFPVYFLRTDSCVQGFCTAPESFLPGSKGSPAAPSTGLMPSPLCAQA